MRLYLDHETGKMRDFDDTMELPAKKKAPHETLRDSLIQVGLCAFFDEPLAASKIFSEKTARFIENAKSAEMARKLLMTHLPEFRENQKQLWQKRQMTKTPSPATLLEFHLDEFLTKLRRLAESEKQTKLRMDILAALERGNEVQSGVKDILDEAEAESAPPPPGKIKSLDEHDEDKPNMFEEQLLRA